jgi:transposase-like protein
VRAAIYARVSTFGQEPESVNGQRLDDAARTLGLSRSTLKRWRREIRRSRSA